MTALQLAVQAPAVLESKMELSNRQEEHAVDQDGVFDARLTEECCVSFEEKQKYCQIWFSALYSEDGLLLGSVYLRLRSGLTLPYYHDPGTSRGNIGWELSECVRQMIPESLRLSIDELAKAFDRGDAVSALCTAAVLLSTDGFAAFESYVGSARVIS